MHVRSVRKKLLVKFFLLRLSIDFEEVKIYNNYMPVSGQDKTINEDGRDKDGFSVNFTNGAKDQLEELKEYFKASNLTEVIKLGVSFLQRVKESEEGRSRNEQK